MRVRHWLAALVLILLIVAGIFIWRSPNPPVPLGFQLARADFASLPGWSTGDPLPALAAFRESCEVILRKPAIQSMGGSGYAGTIGDWRPVCSSLPHFADGARVRKWFEYAFVPFAIADARKSDALFTGYYEPEILASRTRHGSYAAPIYGAPGDLVTADLGSFRKELAGIRISGHVVAARFVPFPPRAEIDAVGLNDAPILLYANDPIAVFFLHIQGSGRVRFDDGTMLRLAYAGQNGRPYTPIGRVLIARGALDRAHMSMQAIRTWLRGHPGDAREIMESDQSYVFFREAPIGDPRLGSPGTEGVPLTPEASIAIDPVFHALGVPMYVAAGAQSFQRLCIAQDTGGAIKGPARADIFWGFGSRAELLAGGMKAAGSLYVLLPKALAARIGPRFAMR